MQVLRRRGTTFVLLAVLAASVAQLDARVDEASKDLEIAQAVARTHARAIDRAAPAVVSIETFGEKEEFGSGLIVRPDGTVLTALHVVRGAKHIRVTLRDKRTYPATVVGRDQDADLALLRPKTKDRGFPIVVLGREDALHVGETVFVIGNPFGLSGSVGRGVLAARSRQQVVPNQPCGLLQTDAPINPGSSGGALVNLRGEVVGLITSILTRNGGHEGAGFAVPASELRFVLDQFGRKNAVERPWIGVRLRPVLGLEPGLRVLAITLDGPAADAGLRKDDIILRVAHRRIETMAELRHALRRRVNGGPVHVGIRRGEQLLELRLTPKTKKP